ncbi:MAG: M15 family metallopeptidase [Polyangiaceae bacterium]
MGLRVPLRVDVSGVDRVSVVAACSGDARDDQVGRSAAAITVEQAAADTNCSTTIVAGLSAQIIEQMQCDAPGELVAVPDRANLVKGSAVFAFMEPPARDALLTTLDSSPNQTMTVNSMLRTLAQQYLLKSWVGTCGITAAANPGSSNHETGLAIDVEEHALWEVALESNGFAWFGSGDVVHFDYSGAGTIDLHPVGVKAFQKLWNLNHPEALIDEDGLYGPQTEAALKQSPADGFAVGATCSPGTGGASGAGGTAGAGGSSGTSGSSGSAGSSGSSGTSGTSGAAGSSGTAGSSSGSAGSNSGSSGVSSADIALSVHDNNGNGCSLVSAPGANDLTNRGFLLSFSWGMFVAGFRWVRRKAQQQAR